MWQGLYYKHAFNVAWESYSNSFPSSVKENVALLKNKKGDITADNFALFTSIASVYSSKIEGEDIQLDSYFKHRFQSISFRPDYTKRTDDLFAAYEFASKSKLSFGNLMEVHRIITRNILPSDKRGVTRTQQMFISDDKGNIRYVAAEAEMVEQEMQHLFADIEVLSNQNLSLVQIFYAASFIHLLFSKIHPMSDGNGRTARLLEKWFLSHFIGTSVWNIESEKYYYDHRSGYYSYLNVIGIEYQSSDYTKALQFLQMLVKSL